MRAAVGGALGPVTGSVSQWFVPVAKRQIIQVIVISRVLANEMVVERQVGEEPEAAVGETDANHAIAVLPGVVGDPGGRVVDRVSVPERTGEDRHGQTRHGNGGRLSEQVKVLGGLIALPRIAIPNPAGGKRIVIAGDDVHRTRDCSAFKEREGSLGNGLGNAVIVEDVPGDQDEVDLMLHGLGPKLLDRLEPCLADPVARALLRIL